MGAELEQGGPSPAGKIKHGARSKKPFQTPHVGFLARVLARARAQAQAQVQAPQAGAPEHPAQQPTQRVVT